MEIFFDLDFILNYSRCFIYVPSPLVARFEKNTCLRLNVLQKVANRYFAHNLFLRGQKDIFFKASGGPGSFSDTRGAHVAF